MGFRDKDAQYDADKDEFRTGSDSVDRQIEAIEANIAEFKAIKARALANPGEYNDSEDREIDAELARWKSELERVAGTI